MPNTADLLVDTLVRWGVDRIYGIPGDGCNGLIEALRLRREDIEFVVVRHEEAAALAASGHAKATGRLGACLATSGPGAIHLLNGLYDAKLDGAPVVSITGQTYSDLQGAHYQQEVNVIALMADVAAYNVQVNGPEHARLATDMACRTAISRRGVAHLSVPIDIQVQTHAEPSPNAVAGTTPPGPIAWRTRPTDDDLQAAANVIAGMRRPLVLAGQGCRGATAELDSLLRRLQAPVSKPLLGKDVLPDDHPHCLGGIGHLGTSASSKAAKECDGLILLGTSFPYVAHLPKPGQAQVVQVDLHPERIGARAPIDVGLVGDVRETLRALLPLVPERKPSGWLRQLREEKQAWEGLLARRADDAGPGERGPLLRPQAAAKAVADILKDNAIICCDTGNVTVWAARHLPMRGDRRFLFSGTLASMGCAVPFAVAAQKAQPERQVVAFVGDGGLMMLPGELATAAHERLPIKVVVFDNGSLGMIRWEQLVFLGNPTYGTQLPKVEFPALAASMGMAAWQATDIASLSAAAAAWAAHDGPALLAVKVDPNEPPWPPTMQPGAAVKLAKALAKGEPHGGRLALTLFRDEFVDHAPTGVRRLLRAGAKRRAGGGRPSSGTKPAPRPAADARSARSRPE